MRLVIMLLVPQVNTLLCHCCTLCRALLITLDDTAIKIPCATAVFYLTFDKPCVMPDSIILVLHTKVRRKLDFIKRRKKVGNSFCRGRKNKYSTVLALKRCPDNLPDHPKNIIFHSCHCSRTFLGWFNGK